LGTTAPLARLLLVTALAGLFRPGSVFGMGFPQFVPIAERQKPTNFVT
jgi:hypothetical protein